MAAAALLKANKTAATAAAAAAPGAARAAAAQVRRDMACLVVSSYTGSCEGAAKCMHPNLLLRDSTADAQLFCMPWPNRLYAVCEILLMVRICFFAGCC